MIFTFHKHSPFNYCQLFINAKTILSSQAIQKQEANWIWSKVHSLIISDLNIVSINKLSFLFPKPVIFLSSIPI